MSALDLASSRSESELRFLYERENARLAMKLRAAERRVTELEHELTLVSQADLTLYEYFLKTNTLIPERVKKVLTHVSI